MGELLHWLPIIVTGTTAALALCGLAYFAAALIAARSYARTVRNLRAAQDATTAAGTAYAPPVSVLKPLRGLDPGMYEAFVSHARQKYSGEYELLFGVATGDSLAAGAVHRLQVEFPESPIRIVEYAQQIGPNGKVGALLQILPSARYAHILINDSDILVGPEYLSRVMACFADAKVGMVTALYSGHCVADANGKIPVWAKLEALTVSTEFVPGALLAMQIDGTVKFALGGTLAIRREALEKIGGLQPLVDYLADDYEMGVRTIAAGYRVAMAPETVATGVPEYSWRQFSAHQLRWLRTVRDARPWGYAGLATTFGLVWAAAAVLASAGAIWSWALLSLSLLARIALALSVGVGILGDRQVLRDIWLVPLRDVIGAALWLGSFGGDDVEWSGIKFRLKKGKLERP
jgi:ceramide glucosyltransferase